MTVCVLYLGSKENVHANVHDEDLSISFDPVSIETIFDDLNAWTDHDIFYALFNLEQGGYINATTEHSDNSMSISCVNFILFDSHEFLDSVRDDTRWNRIKRSERFYPRLFTFCNYRSCGWLDVNSDQRSPFRTVRSLKSCSPTHL